jgi:hypothetical protein
MQVAGAYDAERKAVIMNPAVPESFLNQAEWTRAVTHELVHAYDACRADLRPDSCAHVACTEIRAANLSGDCDFGVEMARAPMKILADGFAGHQRACVRRRAELSLSLHDQCGGGPKGGVRSGGHSSGGVAEQQAAPGKRKPSSVAGFGGPAIDPVVSKTVSAVWDACYADVAPFSTN